MENKICPLLSIASCGLSQPEGLKYCIGNECAFWKEFYQKCCFASIGL